MDNKTINQSICNGEISLNLENILFNIQDGIWSVSYPDFKILYINKAVEDIYGYKTEEFYKDDELWTKCIHPEDRDKIKESVKEILEKGESINERRIINKSGEIVWIADKSRMIYENGKAVRIEGIIRNITKEKLYKEKIKESEEEKNIVLNGIKDVYIELIDEDMNIIFMNEELKKKYGKYDINKKIHCYEFIKGLNMPCANCTVKKAIKSGKVEEGEIADEKGNVFMAKSTPIKDENGKIKRIIHLWIDITERKKMELELLEQKEFLENVNEKLKKEIEERKSAEENNIKLSYAVEQTPVSIVITDMDGNIEYVNRNFTKSTGYTYEEAMGKNPRILKSGLQSKDVYKELWESILAGKEWVGEFSNKRKNGEIFWEKAFISPIKDENGKIISFIAIKEDITEKRKLEKKIIENSKKYNLIFNKSNNAVFSYKIFYEEGKIKKSSFIEVNEVAERKLGYQKSEILEKKIDDIIKENSFRIAMKLNDEELDYRNKDEMEKYLAENNILYEVDFILKNGNIMSGEVSSYLFLENEEEYILMIVKDITERRKIEEKLRKAKEMAEAANKMKTQFLANMSHEIRTPMNSILGFTDIMLEEETDEEKLEKLNIIKNAGKNLIKIINDILDLSKIEAGKLDILQSQFSIKELVYSFYKIFSIQAKEKNIEFIIKIEKNIPDFIFGDEHRINQILMNLISNAFKFTKTGKIHLECSIENEKLILIVKDTGIGIPEEKLEGIFMPFEQADASTTRRYGGTGLGLAITKRLVELLNGNIILRSKVNEGSEFIVEIPMLEIGKRDNAEIGNNMVEKWIEDMGNDDEITEIILMAIVGLRLKINMLQNEIKNKDWKNAARRVHDIKGSTGNLKMKEFYDISKLMEMELMKDEINEENILKMFNNLKTLYSIIPNKYKENNEKSQIDVQNSKEIKILLAEDNEMNQLLIKKILKKIGLECDIANNGKEVLEYLEKNRYNLLFLDLQMPLMDGRETLSEIRRNKKWDNLYIIVLTAEALKGEKEKYMLLGSNDYITKPIDLKEFKEKIKSLLLDL